MNKILAFYGPQQSGKSTAAKGVAMWKGWHKVSFADPLYNMMSALLGRAARHVEKEEPLELLRGATLRHALQTLGTEWGRGCISDEIWIDQMDRHFGEGYLNVVVDDLRFRNEYEFLRDRGATIVKVERGVEDTPEQEHASEQDWEGFSPDIVLANDQVTEWAWQGKVRAELKHLL